MMNENPKQESNKSARKEKDVHFLLYAVGILFIAVIVVGITELLNVSDGVAPPTASEHTSESTVSNQLEALTAMDREHHVRVSEIEAASQLKVLREQHDASYVETTEADASVQLEALRAQQAD